VFFNVKVKTASAPTAFVYLPQSLPGMVRVEISDDMIATNEAQTPASVLATHE